MKSHRVLLYGFVITALTAFPTLADTTGVVVRLSVPNGMVVVDDDATFNAYQLTVSPARDLSALKLSERVSLDPKSKTLTAGSSRFVINRAVNLDIRNIKIVSVDPEQGRVKAEFVATGEVIHFQLKPEGLKRRGVQPGQTVAIGSMATAGLLGNCACGQKPDGSCWCVTWQDSCCGPLMGPGCRCDPNRRKDARPWF